LKKPENHWKSGFSGFSASFAKHQDSPIATTDEGTPGISSYNFRGYGFDPFHCSFPYTYLAIRESHAMIAGILP
jgi:hypothetical protein